MSKKQHTNEAGNSQSYKTNYFGTAYACTGHWEDEEVHGVMLRIIAGEWSSNREFSSWVYELTGFISIEFAPKFKQEMEG